MRQLSLCTLAGVLAALCAPTLAQAQTAPDGAQADPYTITRPYGAGFSRERTTRSEFDLRLGGHIKLDAIVDSQQINSDLPFFALPDRVVTDGALAPNPQDKTVATNLAARELLLNLSVATPDYGDWAASAYIEFNFLGFLQQGANAGSPTPILRHGYTTLANKDSGTSLLFGLAQGPFAPIDPQTVNWETYVLMGDAFTRLPQLRLSQTVGDLSASVAAVRPADYLNDSRRGYDLQGRGQDSGLPEVQGLISYKLPGTGHYWFYDSPGSVGLSGRFARERFNAGTDAEEDVSSWTVAANWLVPLGPLTLTGEVYYGANTDNVYGLAGVSGVEEGGVFNPGDPVKEVGGWAQLGWNVTPRIYTSIIYGTIRPDKKPLQTLSIDNGLGITRNQAVTANLYYRLLPTLFVAGEYVWLETDYWVSAAGIESQTVSGTLHRGQLSFLFSF